MNQVPLNVSPTNVLSIDPAHANYPLYDQVMVRDTWKSKYRFPGETHPNATFIRCVNGVYAKDPLGAQYAPVAAEAMCKGLIAPGGRIVAGAGTDKRVTLFQCYVAGTIVDSIPGIADTIKNTMTTLSMSGGVGHDLTPIRPKGAQIKGIGAGALAAGVLNFLSIFDAQAYVLMGAGSRRGAMMMVLSDHHPDIVDWINAKHVAGKYTMCNMSVLVSDAFMQAVEDGELWELYHEVPPADRAPLYSFFDDSGKEFFVWAEIPARELWDMIIKSTYDYAEPGVIYIDRVNELNNLNYCETIRATNPCGEQPLPPHGCCDLGHINLARLVKKPFTLESEFDWALFDRCVSIMVRFLDNVIDVTNFPLDEQYIEESQKRRIGIGYMGLADALAQLGIVYGSPEAIAFTEALTRRLANTAYSASADLAAERGPFPLYNENAILNAPFVKTLDPKVQQKIANLGLRNGVLLSIAPTGTMAIMCGNVAGGHEPTFLNFVKRDIISQQDGKTQTYYAYGYAYHLFAHLSGNDPKEPGNWVPEYLVTADQVSVKGHLEMHAAASKWIDASVSKTINVPENISFDEFKGVYLDAYKLGCKGCTTYRPSDVRGAVLMDPNAKPKTVTPTGPRQRQDVLTGRTYKVKWQNPEVTLYVTINDQENKPFEIMIVSTGNVYDEFIVSTTRLISAILRLSDSPEFIINELKQISSMHNGSYQIVDGKATYFPSMSAYVGHLLEKHLMVGQSGPQQASLAEEQQVKFRSEGAQTKSGGVCRKCGSRNVVREQGCKKCLSCNESECG
jgi:ribonucleoside-diphosphate reductase alpha chain